MAMVSDPEDDRTSRRWRWILLTVIGVLPFAAIGTFVASFDPEIFKPQIVNAVKQATGRDLVIQGRIYLALSLRPTIAADRVSFANAPGGSRADMVTLERIEARIALLPLLQHQLEIDSLSLVRPDVLLETDAQGRGNWQFNDTTPGPAGRAGQPAAPGGGQAGGQARTAFFVRNVRIDDGRFAWRDGRTGAVSTFAVRQAELQTESATAPISLTMEAMWNTMPLAISGQVGSLSALQGQSAVPWPLRLIVTSGEAKLSLSGVAAQPLQGKGYQLKLEGTAPGLAALAPLLPGARLPALRDVSLVAEVTDRGAALPDIANLVLRAGAGDLGALTPGLQLSRLELSMPRLDQPVRVTAEGSLNGAAVALSASLGAPGQFLAGVAPTATVPVDLALSAAGARITAKGSVTNPSALVGMDLAVQASIPDLGELGRLAGLGLPRLRDLTARAQIAAAPGGLARGVSLRGLQIGGPVLNVAGDLTLTTAARLGVQGSLTARRIDADALRAAMGNSAAPTPVPTSTQARGQPAGRATRFVIPDEPLPFAALRLADGDLQLRVEELIQGGETIRNLVLRAVLNDGRLRMDPFSAELPAGRISGSVTVDATRADPAVTVVLRSPGLDIGKIYHAIGRPGAASGVVEVDLDLRGDGQSPHAIAATADGHLGLAVVGGSVDNSMLNLGFLGDILRGVNQGQILARGGSTQVRCFAFRVDARAGQGDVRALLLDSSTMLVEGGGGLNLGNESLALRLRAQPRLLGVGLALPLRVNGGFAAPSASLDPLGSAGALGQSVTGTVGGALGTVGSGLGAVGGALGIGNGGSALPGTDTCGPQLAIARGGRAGAAAAADPAQDAPAAANPRGQGNRQRPPNPLQRLLPR